MFGLFGTREDKQLREKITWAQDASLEILMTQMELGGASSDRDSQRRLATPYGFGYVFGFADALIQRAGVGDDARMIAELATAHIRLFGTEQGPKIFSACLSRQSDPQFLEGRRTGGVEASQWLSSGGKDIPSGLSDYLSAR